MLDTDSGTENTPTEKAPAAPRRRRAASRPAGAPAKVDPPAIAAAPAAAAIDPAPVTPAIDPAWTATLNSALKTVRLPVRSVLARPEISLVKLLSLEVGDIIPLTIPRNVPVTVAGRSFASGGIGESNGNAAIMIERIEEGPDND